MSISDKAFQPPEDYNEWLYGHYYAYPDQYHKYWRTKLDKPETNPFLPEFSAENDATMVNLAMKGPGTDEKQLMAYLAGRSNAQVQEMRKAYDAKFGDLLKDIEGETSGSFKKCCIALAKSDTEYDVWQLHDAMDGIGTRESVLIEVLTSRTNKELKAIKSLYEHTYGRTLEKDIKDDTSRDFERVLLSLCEANRDETREVDLATAEQDANRLYRAGEKRLGTEDDIFIETFTKRSPSQLLAIKEFYNALSEKSFEEAIKSETSGSYKDTFLALVDVCRFAATILGGAIRGAGTDDKRLVRTVRSLRSHGGRLHFVKKEYLKLFQETLVTSIEGDTRGAYMQCLRRMAATSRADWRAILVREATRGVGTTNKLLIETVTSHRNNRDQRALCNAYKLDYGKGLRHDLKAEIHGHYKEFVRGVLQKKENFDAEAMHHAMAGVIGTKESALIEILTSRSNSDIKRMREAYEKKYGKSLRDAIEGDTSFNFENILISLLKGTRYEEKRDPDDVDSDDEDEGEGDDSMFDANKVVESLYKGGEGRLGTSDDLFISIMTQHSPKQLQEVNRLYAEKHGHDLYKAIEKETSGDYRDCLQACIDPDRYAAQCLYKAMKGMGTNDRALIRVLAPRTRQEIEPIKEKFQEMYGKSLAEWIKGDTSGDYCKALLTHIGIPLSEQ